MNGIILCLLAGVCVGFVLGAFATVLGIEMWFNHVCREHETTPQEVNAVLARFNEYVKQGRVKIE